MNSVAERYRNVAGTFTERVVGATDDGWNRPAPCEGWVARDVVRHLVEWFPPFLERGAGLTLPAGPPVEDDPVTAWTTMSDGIQRILDDPATASRPFAHPQAGEHRLDEAIGMFFLGDVLIHTWDLARATGQDERLDPAEVHDAYVGMQPFDDALRASGHYGPKVEVAADADEQTKLLGFTGRRP